MTNRLFISLDIPNSALEDIINLRDGICPTENKVKWEHEDKLHITIKYLGDVGENIAELLERRFSEIEINKIKVKFNKFAFFYKNGSPKILYTGFEQNDDIYEFHKLIEQESALIGFDKEKRNFKPHITLLRIKDSTNIENLGGFKNTLIDIPPFEIKTFSIIKSELEPSGSVYTKIKSFELI